MYQMLNIWHISHTKHKKQLLSDVTYVSKLYHLCSYRCKFATVWTNVVNQNNVFFLFGFLSPLTYGLDFFSLFSHQTQLFPQQRKNKMTHSTSSWARPLQSDHRHCHCRRRCKRHGRGYSDHRHRHHCRRRKRHGWGHSDHRHRHRRSKLADLSLSFGGWLFWLLVVGWFWLIVVGWSGCGCEIWDGYEILVDGVFFWCRGWYWL